MTVSLHCVLNYFLEGTISNERQFNFQVHEKNGKTKRIVPKEEFEITNSMWKLKRKPKTKTEDALYGDFFVKKAILTSGGAKTKKVNDVESEDEEMVETDPVTMTDEELFAACEGRTAHKYVCGGCCFCFCFTVTDEYRVL